MVLKTPERARRAGVPFGDALGFVELVRDAVRGGGTRVDRLGGARRSLEHALLPIDVRALGAAVRADKRGRVRVACVDRS